MAVLYMILVLTLVLAACSNKDENKKATGNSSSGDDVLEFYHGYHQDEDEWPVAQVMRDLYNKFAEEHATGDIEFEPIPVNDGLPDIMNNKVASGEFPDVIDLAGDAVSMAAIEQELTLDLKPYIDENGLEDNVGLNYTQNDVDGKLYTVHEQLFTMGLWYNQAFFEDSGAAEPAEWSSWDDFLESMEAVRQDDVYAFGAGEPALQLFNTALGGSENGRDYLDEPLTEKAIESDEFKEALKTTMTAVNENGSEHADGDTDSYSADFVDDKSAAFFNGVWVAGDVVENEDIAPGIYPENVAISSSGGGITISNDMSEEKEELALEFLKYMTSDEVQEVIFSEVRANPSNQNIDVKKLADESDDPTDALLGEAISLVNDADHQVPSISDSWGGDVRNALINALSESGTENIDVDQKVEETQDVLLSLIM